MELGPRGRISGRAHEDRSLALGEAGGAARKLTSGEAISLACGCCFERVHAPEVRFGRGKPSLVQAAVPHERAELSALPGARRRTASLFRFTGDCELAEGCHYAGSLIVDGTLSIGAGTVVEGNVKARKGILVGRGAHITGSVICQNGIHVLDNAEIGGPVLSETHVLLAAGARVGEPDAPTTVSATAIIAQEGVVAHGTVWARKAGVVWGPAG